MSMANTLAYYDMATITAVKSFLVQAQGWVAKKLLTNFLCLVLVFGCLITKMIITFQVSLDFIRHPFKNLIVR